MAIIGSKKPCLNRTSVGLKPAFVAAEEITRTVPQSNQRGIETMEELTLAQAFADASIEPAWD